MDSYINPTSQFAHLQNGIILPRVKIVFKQLIILEGPSTYSLYSKHSADVVSSSCRRQRSRSDLAVCYLIGRNLSLGIYTEGVPLYIYKGVPLDIYKGTPLRQEMYRENGLTVAARTCISVS